MQEDTEKAESLESTSVVAEPKKKKPRKTYRKISLREPKTTEKVTPKEVIPKSPQEALVRELKAEYPSLKFRNKDGNKYFYEYNKSTVLIEGEHDKNKLIYEIGRAEKYYEVMFSQRIDKNETKNVQLSVNGDLLLFERGVKTIAPGRYLSASDDACYPIYVQDEKHNRKITGWVKFYPYQKQRLPYDLKENPNGVTEADFFKLKAEGNKKQQLAKEIRENA